MRVWPDIAQPMNLPHNLVRLLFNWRFRARISEKLSRLQLLLPIGVSDCDVLFFCGVLPLSFLQCRFDRLKAAFHPKKGFP
jgi:hypothetical protein